MYHIIHAQNWYEFCISFLFSWLDILNLNQPFSWRVEVWEPFKMKLIWGLQSRTLVIGSKPRLWPLSSYFLELIWMIYSLLKWYVLLVIWGPHPIMLTIESRMVIIFWACSSISFEIQGFLVSVLESTPGQISLKHRFGIKIKNDLGMSILGSVTKVCRPSCRHFQLHIQSRLLSRSGIVSPR